MKQKQLNITICNKFPFTTQYLRYLNFITGDTIFD